VVGELLAKLVSSPLVPLDRDDSRSGFQGRGGQGSSAGPDVDDEFTRPDIGRGVDACGPFRLQTVPAP
jgi:hypothetical protein